MVARLRHIERNFKSPGAAPVLQPFVGREGPILLTDPWGTSLLNQIVVSKTREEGQSNFGVADQLSALGIEEILKIIPEPQWFGSTRGRL